MASVNFSEGTSNCWRVTQMHIRSKAVIENIELARDIARSQFGDSSLEVVLKVAALLASHEVKEELAEISGCLLHPLEIHSK
jgi:hypothetical protein